MEPPPLRPRYQKVAVGMCFLLLGGYIASFLIWSLATQPYDINVRVTFSMMALFWVVMFVFGVGILWDAIRRPYH